MTLPILGIYLGKNINRQDTGTPIYMQPCLQDLRLVSNINVLGRKKMDKEDVALMYNGILLSHEMNEIRPVAATWINLDVIILRHIIQIEEETYHKISLIGCI